MRPAAHGATVHSNPQRRSYPARLDSDAFALISVYQRDNGVSFNAALNALVRLAGQVAGSATDAKVEAA
jgi:hypothetical protein